MKIIAFIFALILLLFASVIMANSTGVFYVNESAELTCRNTSGNITDTCNNGSVLLWQGLAQADGTLTIQNVTTGTGGGDQLCLDINDKVCRCGECA